MQGLYSNFFSDEQFTLDDIGKTPVHIVTYAFLLSSLFVFGYHFYFEK
jgi:hypothetical protein